MLTDSDPSARPNYIAESSSTSATVRTAAVTHLVQALYEGVPENELVRENFRVLIAKTDE
jgi:hypothetical protein